MLPQSTLSVECCINCTKGGALACTVTSTRHSLPFPCVMHFILVLEIWNRIAEIKGLLWHFGNYCCFLHLQFLPLGSFPFVLFFLCCLKGLVFMYTVMSSQVCLGKELPPAPSRVWKRSSPPNSDFQKVTGSFPKVTLFILAHKSFNAVKFTSEIWQSPAVFPFCRLPFL